MQYVEDQARKAGIVVPFISNDAAPLGTNVPGSGPGAVDIYVRWLSGVYASCRILIEIGP
jgi:hypothetical protein